MKRKIGILGGTFDPPHIGHEMVALAAKEYSGLNEVRFMPAFSPPHKTNINATPEQRLHMLHLMSKRYSCLLVETLELRRQEKMHTVDTIKLLQRREPDSIFYFIMGGDMLIDLPNWREPSELLALAKVVCVNRATYSSNLSNFAVDVVQSTIPNISSTEIRGRICNGQPVYSMLVKSVHEYIMKEKLYGC